jgi:eukaryotic-like serine/threonine-protein kinase
MAAAEVDPLVGKTLNGRFKILSPLGAGGMGRVYKATQSNLDRLVALKVLNPKYNNSKDPGFERRFFLEAAMTAKLHHANTITVHDYGRTDDGIFFIAMEYVEGLTLQQELAQNGPMPWRRAVPIAQQICRSLREAHKLGLIHRDLKPANVMVLSEETGGDVVKVLDFGLVKSFLAETPLPGGPENPGEITQAGVLMGSPLYMAPEQVKNESDPRSDIYALGVLLYQCITGSPPFTGKDSIDIIVRHLQETPRKPSELVAGVPEALNNLVMKCLEKEPRRRYQTMDEVLDALKLLGDAAGVSGAFFDPRVVSMGPAASQSRSGARAGGKSGAAMPHSSSKMTPFPKAVEAELVTAESEVPRGRRAERGVKRTTRKLLFVAVAMASSLVSLAVVVALLRRAPPPAVVVEPAPANPTKVTVQETPPAPPQEVVFDVSSTPQGATIVDETGKVLGVTPLQFTRMPGESGLARAVLSFSLEGYEALEGIEAAGSDTVKVAMPLKRRPAAQPPAVKPVRNTRPEKSDKSDKPPGYKDDPY